mgnify:FL=1
MVIAYIQTLFIQLNIRIKTLLITVEIIMGRFQDAILAQRDQAYFSAIIDKGNSIIHSIDKFMGTIVHLSMNSLFHFAKGIDIFWTVERSI